MEKSAEYYNKFFASSKEYQLHYKNSVYYVHWTQVLQMLNRIDSPIILEVGCGPGQLANYLFDEGFINYSGFDFSSIAIENALANFPSYNFWIGNGLEEVNFLKYDYNTIICLEVLEHVKDDLVIIENIKIGTNIIFSVPNFDLESHVRWFTRTKHIKSRYYRKINIQEIIRIGDIFICRGIRSDFNPNILQRLLFSREKIDNNTFIKAIKYKIKQVFRIKWL